MRGTPNDNGFETLRMLHEQLGRTKRQTMITTLMRIVLQMFDENTCIEQLTKFKFDISECERVTSERLPELFRIVGDNIDDIED